VGQRASPATPPAKARTALPKKWLFTDAFHPFQHSEPRIAHHRLPPVVRMPPSQEQLEDAGLRAWEVTKANFAALGEAGLFNFEHVLQFSKDLATPFNPEYVTPEGFQSIILARTTDLTVRSRHPKRLCDHGMRELTRQWRLRRSPSLRSSASSA
jgi:hypothetical protein